MGERLKWVKVNGEFQWVKWVKVNGEFQWVKKETTETLKDEPVIKKIPKATSKPKIKKLYPPIITKQRTAKPPAVIIKKIRYNPKDRTMISFYIDNKIHQRLKQVCDKNKSRGIKTAVSDLINMAIVKCLKNSSLT